MDLRKIKMLRTVKLDQTDKVEISTIRIVHQIIKTKEMHHLATKIVKMNLKVIRMRKLVEWL